MNKKKNAKIEEQEARDNLLSLCIAIGMCVGVGLGYTIGTFTNEPITGMSLGIVAGLFVGVIVNTVIESNKEK